MSFVEDYIEPEKEPVSEVTRRRFEMMISVACLSSEDKFKLEMKGVSITEEEALRIITSLQERMPIMGLHSIPLDVKEQGKAIRYQVDKDDFHEQRFKK